MDTLKKEMGDYYARTRASRIAENETFQSAKNALWKEMDDYEKDHPQMAACLLKAKTHELIAESFEPVIFRHCPFFFETGAKYAESWGVPNENCFGSWMTLRRRDALCLNSGAMGNIMKYHAFRPDPNRLPWKLWSAGAFDTDHHCLGYTKLLSLGVNGVIAQIIARRKAGGLDQGQIDFLEAAERSCHAVVRMAERFAGKAERMLSEEKDPLLAGYLSMVVDAARRVPANPPETFHEGLASMIFLREAVGTLESIGISVVGHPDRMLIKLYEKDLKEGRITESSAADMIARWMVHTDVRFHLDDNQWPETSTCVELGGCDEDGRPLYNALTRLFIETHRAQKLLNPKLNCRYSSKSPKEYLDLLAHHATEGHNCFAFLNDDVLIDACMRSGKSERDARLYVNGGCQETMLEGVEHSAGAYYYFNIARLFDLFMRRHETEPYDSMSLEVLPAPPETAKDFEEFYSAFSRSLATAVAKGAGWMAEVGGRWREVNPAPFFSATLAGCVENASDYTAGGAKYNSSGAGFIGLGTVVDSLNAIRIAVFEKKFIDLNGLRNALAANWKGYETLRIRMAALPKYGHGDEDADALAARVCKTIAEICAPLKNERGGNFQPTLFVYYTFVTMGKHVRATPDGRHDAEMLSQGCSPGRVQAAENLTDVLRGIGRIDLRDFPGNAVLDVQMPLMVNKQKSVNNFSGLLRSFANLGGATLQTNCVSVDMLHEAQAHPERHGDLVVRISGLSAKFTSLAKDVQDEIIARNMPL